MAKREHAPRNVDDRKEACKTFIEQTKLLVTLSSGFVLAPPAFLSLRVGKEAVLHTEGDVRLFLAAELLQILCVLFGYLTLGSVAGSQDDGSYNVYRPATMRLSRIQIVLYLAGIALFVVFVAARVVSPQPT